MQGEVSEAVTFSAQSVKYADRSTDELWQMLSRVTEADALHQAGRLAKSRKLLTDAESRQAVFQPIYPQLYSLQGFKFCDLLLSSAERTAWQAWHSNGETNQRKNFRSSTASCDAVSERALYALKIAEDRHWLLDTALGYLTLARTMLYKTRLPIPQVALNHIATAVEGLRAAGTTHHLSRGLLTRAWLRCLSGDEPGCRADLDEAWEIAQRGPMPLHQADILLYRARLFRDRDALAEARRLIEKHGYHRRVEELADAEEAAKGWSESPPSEAPQTHAEPSEESMRDLVFISYSHRDTKFLEELLTHLKPYLRSGSIMFWSDKQIAAGSKWCDEIRGKLSQTSVAVLLVSPDFLASDFIHEHELGPLLKEAEAGGVKILWVPIQASAYEETPLKHYQAVSAPDVPLGVLGKAERNGAWVQVCKEIKKA